MAVLAHPRWVGRPWAELRWVLVTVPGLMTAEESWTLAQATEPPVVQTTDYIAGLAATEAGVGVMVGSRALVGRSGLVALDAPVALPEATPLWLVGHEASRQSTRIDAVWRALAQWAREDLSGPGAPSSGAG
jgi:DNA-binding transcriptional LysR family regulator